MNNYIENIKTYLKDPENTQSTAVVLSLLTFTYEYRVFKKTRIPMVLENWLTCITAAGISYGLTIYGLDRFQQYEDNVKMNPNILKEKAMKLF
jgi:hypothetical protein